MLADAVRARRTAESRKLAEEKREREARERDELLKLDATPTKDLNRAIATLLTYQKAHADAAQDPALCALAEDLAPAATAPMTRKSCTASSPWSARSLYRRARSAAVRKKPFTAVAADGQDHKAQSPSP
jgi:hypothetical protein